jgi:hypothetical protein
VAFLKAQNWKHSFFKKYNLISGEMTLGFGKCNIIDVTDFKVFKYGLVQTSLHSLIRTFPGIRNFLKLTMATFVQILLPL